MNFADLFAGLGGFTTAGKMAGLTQVWSANHWQEAVAWHYLNHPEVRPACQDLQQANFNEVPDIDLLLASPCCQGHTNAKGREAAYHDASRATAWAVVAAIEAKRPRAALVENVPEFLKWALYPAWKLAMEALGYAVSPHISDAADFGVPQNRVRVFIALTRSKNPISLKFRHVEHVPIDSVLDWEYAKWSDVEKPGRSQATLDRLRSGRARHGDRFVAPFYSSGSGKTGRSVHRPLGTVTTKDRWLVVKGDKCRILNRFEARDAMGFPADTKLPDNHKLALHLLGNAVCPPQGAGVIEALKACI